jgi:hypothetical protein
MTTVAVSWLLLCVSAPVEAASQQLPLPTRVGQSFPVDGLDHVVTQNDLGFNLFAGNVGTTESSNGITTLELTRSARNGRGGSLLFSFDFTNQSETAFAGFFESLFGLTDTYVSLDGSGEEPLQTTQLPGYFLDTEDLFRSSRAFSDLGLEELRLDIRLISNESLVLKIEIKDESGFDVFTRRTVAPSGDTWQTISLALPEAFTDSVQGGGSSASFNWRQVSLLSVIVERENHSASISNPDSGTFLIDNITLVDTDGTYPDLSSPTLTDPGDGSLLPAFRDAFLEHVRRLSLQYFLDFASTDPRTGGIVQDRSTFADLLTTGGIGFQLNAYCIAAERGDLDRDDAAARAVAILRVLHDHPQGPSPVGTIGYKGFFYHFLGIDGLRKQNFDFNATPDLDESLNTVELSPIDTALAIAGVVTAGRYFNGTAPVETEIATLAEEIYARVDWPFMIDPATNQAYLGWKPNEQRDDDCGKWGRFKLDDDPVDPMGQYSSKEIDGTEIAATMDYYSDEGLLIALLGMASPNPDHRLGRAVWDAMIRDDASSTFVKTYPGSLFTYTFASMWLDTYALGADSHPTHPLNFFQNTQEAVAATRSYTISNPGDCATWRNGRGAVHWGLSASEGPFDSYFAFAAPPAALATAGVELTGCPIEIEAESGPADCVTHPRSNASGQIAVLLQSGESHTLTFSLAQAASAELTIRYSNDNFGPLEEIAVAIDQVTIGTFRAEDTGDWGHGWNVFLTSDSIGPVTLGTGAHELTIGVDGGDGNGVEIDMVSITPTPQLRPLSDGTTTVYGAGSAAQHVPDLAVAALWAAARDGLLHPRFGFADAFNLEIADAELATSGGLRTSGPWASFTGFAIDQGPLLIAIDSTLHGHLIAEMFMSHSGVRNALRQLFPHWVPTSRRRRVEPWTRSDVVAPAS